MLEPLATIFHKKSRGFDAARGFLIGLLTNQLGSRTSPMLIKLKKKKMDTDFLYFMNDPDLIVGFLFTISLCHVKKNIFVQGGEITKYP